jgi:hypothetical protein
MKQKKYEPVEDYYNKFLRLCVTILQQPDDIYLKEAFQEGHRRNRHRRTLVEVVESTITVEEKLPMIRKNTVKYCQNDFDSDEYDDFDKKMSIIKKRLKRSLRK